MFYNFSKKCFDIFFSSFGLILLSPLIIIITMMIFLILGKPVFFSQKRAGFGGKTFTIYKFRTMTNVKNKKEILLPDEERLTKFGNFLRKSSLDELPGLFNVLLGNMSLVGPRPLLIEYNALYSKKHKLRLSVMPGITGWAQINGRNSLSWNEKFDLDVWYVENRSIVLDIMIIFKTIFKVLKSADVLNQQGKMMSKFNGYDNR